MSDEFWPILLLGVQLGLVLAALVFVVANWLSKRRAAPLSQETK